MHTARTLVVLEPLMREAVRRIAEKEGVSISSKCRDLIREALELEEDSFWNQKASAREKPKPKKWLSHQQIWGK